MTGTSPRALTVLRCVVPLALLGTSAARAAEPGVATPRQPSEQLCAAGTPLPATLLQPGGLLLFGEIHGAQELPAAFGDAICSAVSTGLPVEVGLEIPRSEQASIDSFLASPGGPSEVAALIVTAFWTRDTQDGRSSQAMLALLERIRRLRHGGLPVDVFAFDLDSSQDGSRRDQGMADNIAAHVRAHPQALAMALTGEVHAWKTEGAPWKADFLPMGWHLAKGGLKVRSLGRVTPAGTAWICTGASSSTCGLKETGPAGALPSGRAVGIELLPEPSARGYDGMFAVPTLTASPPATASRADR